MSHFFSHRWEYSIETKRIDDRQSFERVRHRQKKKKSKKRTMTFIFSGAWMMATHVSHDTPALCSFFYVDVGEPTRHPCMTGMMQDHRLPQLRATWSHLEHLFVGIDITSCRSTERPDFFSESVVSYGSPGVFLWCFGFVFGWVCFVLFWKTPGLLSLFSNMWE